MTKKIIQWECAEQEQDVYGDEKEDQFLAMQTPMGIVGMIDELNPMKKFKFWSVSTNFAVKNDMGLGIEEVDGVEVFFPLSRYQFVISFGKLFDEDLCKKQVEEVLTGEFDFGFLPDDEEVENEEIETLKTELASKHKHWAIFLGSDGNIHHHGGSREDVNKYLEMYQEAKAIHNGRIFHSDQS